MDLSLSNLDTAGDALVGAEDDQGGVVTGLSVLKPGQR